MSSAIEIISAVGFVSVIGGLLHIGRKLQVLDDVKITTDKIKANVKVLTDFLIRANTSFDPSELQSYSPLQMTDVGRKLIAETGFGSVFDVHRQEFFQLIDEEEPKLQYDVEQAAIKSVYTLAEKEYMDFLKVFFYNHPDRKLENTASTFGVYIRDQYLQEHPEITQ